ncbi:MAG: GNAT family N-acetyltransferase [Myxococcota bacterium]
MSPAVRVLKPEERDRTSGVLTLAFSNDPMMRWFMPDPATFLDLFPRTLAPFAGEAYDCGTAYVDADFRGASLWLPPGVKSDMEAMGVLMAGALEPEFLAAAAPFFEQMEAHHPKDPHWYLPVIGVDPAHQGAGVGSALLSKALERVDADGLPAYLESSNIANVPLYRRHGFEVLAEIQVADSPVMYPMSRAGRG